MKLKLLSCCFLLFILSCQSLTENIPTGTDQAVTASFAGNLSVPDKDFEPAHTAVTEKITAAGIPSASVILGKSRFPYFVITRSVTGDRPIQKFPVPI
jgi:hypothetical protein